METKKKVIILASIAITLALIAVLLQGLDDDGSVETSIGDGGVLNSEGSGQIKLAILPNGNVEDKGNIIEEGEGA
jgi:hypothetical protein